MSRWYLDENDRDIYLKDDKGTRWNYNTKELVRILNDLEAKLEESEQSKESYRLQDNDHHSKLWQFYSRLGVEAFGADIHEKALEEFGKLKQQLADTEAQNKRVLEKIDLIVRSNQELEQKVADLQQEQIDEMKEHQEALILAKKCIKNLEEQLAEKDQDKISFVVEQLEKVKELLFSKAIQLTGTSVDTVRLYSINEIFNNQIKQLKEME